ncbi:MAG: lasso peptide biosynthesis protein [Xanthobacteraceae bacterium]|jgi:hypothetical protein|nr:lasso peptide biosynthesis protein [Xanthobacteraceae bacterium]
MLLSLGKRVRFRAELWLAARLLPFQIAGKSFEDVLAVVPSQPNRIYLGLPADYISGAVRKATRNPILMRDRKCLRQGLLAFGYMAQAGLRPELRFGIKPDSMNAAALAAHCWVCIDNVPVLSDKDPDMVTIHVHRV